MLAFSQIQRAVIMQSFIERKANLERQMQNLDIEYKKIALQKMTTPQRIVLPLRNTKAAGIGVYFIIHCNNATVNMNDEQNIFTDDPNVKIMYIGQGKITGRKFNHLQIFKNNGKPCIWETNNKITSSVDSVAGRKMYEYDSNINNWYFSYITTGKEWSPIMENYFINELKPQFNDEKMNGVA